MARTDSLPRATVTRSYRHGVRKILQGVDKSQSDKFKEKARELGADDDEAAFEERLKRLAKAKPKKEAPAK